jgi:uncharacterized membrane-anchored protein
MDSRSDTRRFSKVPEVTAYFWIVKALTTGMGESTSDFLVHRLVPEIAVVLGIAFVIALYIQFSTRLSLTSVPTTLISTTASQ